MQSAESKIKGVLVIEKIAKVRFKIGLVNRKLKLIGIYGIRFTGNGIVVMI